MNRLRCASGHLYIAESRHRRAVGDAHRLHRIALAAVRQSPDTPRRAVADRVTGAPEVGRIAGVERIAQQASEAAVLDLPGDLAAELEIETEVVDRPRFVRVDEDAALRVADDLVERGRAGLEVDVGHADDRNPRRAL